MIISASRRTDIPAFYTPWFVQRIRSGFCDVPNPFNPQQVMRVSLAPEDVDVIVFWTRHARPLFPHLVELGRLGYRYYFQYTLLDNPHWLDPRTPPLMEALATFTELASRIGPERLIWRYDPIVLTDRTPPDFHLDAFGRIAEALRGATFRAVISFLDLYPKVERRLGKVAKLLPVPDEEGSWLGGWVRTLVDIAAANGMQVHSCAEKLDLAKYSVQPGKCIDDEYIRQVFALEVSHTKDPHQRPACGCVVSKDIGAYDTCVFGCLYCYATNSIVRAQRRYAAHNPQAPSLVG